MSRIEEAQESEASLCRWCFEPLGAERHSEIWICEEDGATCHRGCVEAGGRCPSCKRPLEALADSDSQSDGEVFGGAIEEKDPRDCVYSSERALTREDVTELLNSLDPLRALQSELHGPTQLNTKELLKFIGALLVGSQLFGYIIWAKVMPKEPWLATQLWHSLFFIAIFALVVFIQFIKYEVFVEMSERRRANMERMFTKKVRKSGEELSAKDLRAKALLVLREEMMEAIWTLLESRHFERGASECRRELKKLLDIQSELEDYSLELFEAENK